MIMVDSSVWIDYFNGRQTPETTQLDLLLGIEPIAIGDIILTEVFGGFRDDKDYKIAKNLLASLTIYELLGEKMALQSADNYRTLRKQGITIRKTVDVIIASFCIKNNLPLLFSDKDFLPFVRHLKLISVKRAIACFGLC